MNHTVNREELISEIAGRCDIPKEKARRFIEALEDVVIRAMASEDRVKFSFGYLGGRTTKPMKKLCPNGEIRHIPEKHGQPYYKPSKLAKDY